MTSTPFAASTSSAVAQAGTESACVSMPRNSGPSILLPLPIQANRLGDREDVPFVEGLVERRTAMSGGAKRHPLRGHRGIGRLGIVGRDEPRHIDQHSGWRRLSGQGTYFHGEISFAVIELSFRQSRNAWPDGGIMTLRAAESRGEKCLNQFPARRWPTTCPPGRSCSDSSSSTPLVRRKASWTQARVAAGHLVPAFGFGADPMPQPRSRPDPNRRGNSRLAMRRKSVVSTLLAPDDRRWPPVRPHAPAASCASLCRGSAGILG